MRSVEFPPIPSELVVPLAGFVAARGMLRLDLVIAVAWNPPCCSWRSAWLLVKRYVTCRRRPRHVP